MCRIIYLLAVAIFLSVKANVVFLTDSPIQNIGTRMYKQELLTNEYSDAKELAYDSSSRKLFFMYMDDVVQNSGRAWVNVISKQSMKIKGIEHNRATAVDADTGDVYFGTEDGLYKYNPIQNEAVNIGLYNVNILKLVIRNNEMYIIDANNHMIYKVFFTEGVRVKKVGDMKTVMEFDVDNQKNIHYVSMCGVYCAAEGQKIVKNKDLSVVYHFIVDGDKTLGVTYDGIYDINCMNGTASRVSDITFFPRSIVFGDYGDIFYSIDNKVYRLRPVTSYLVYYVNTRQQNKIK